MAAEDHIDFLDEREDDTPAYQAAKTCLRCGVGGLRWLADDKGYYLADEEGYAHECDESDLQAVTLDDFADITG